MKRSSLMKSIRLGRIVIAGILVPISTILLITLLVTVYAFILAFEARGAPDQARLTLFAGDMGRTYGWLLQILLVIPVALWGLRKVRDKLPLHGMLIGFLAALLGIVMSLTLSVRTVGEFALTVGAGWLAGVLVMRRRNNQLPETSNT
jgi:hypothetical protein